MTSRSLPVLARRWIGSNTVFLAFLLGGMVPDWAVARQATVAVIGSVTDTFATPLPDVLVRVAGTGFDTRTDAGGRFWLTDLVPGEYTLELMRLGFRSRTLRVTVPDGERGDLDVGSFVMQRSTGSTVTVSGIVFDEATGSPVSSVPIQVNGRIVALTDDGGAFHAITDAIERGATNSMVLQRIGYVEAAREFIAPADRDTLDFTILLKPAPVRLEEIGVEADVVPLTTGRMTGFYRRRATNLGHFFTQDDIETMGARKASDVLRRIPGVTILTNENTTNLQEQVGWIDPMIIQFRQRGGWRSNSLDCKPLVFVNDLQVDHPNLDALIFTNEIAGMEVYESEARIPIEYNKRGSECGVLVFWTDAPTGEAVADHHVEIGFQFASQVRNGGSSAERVGVHVAVRLTRTLEFRPGFSLVIGDADVPPSYTYQILGNLTLKPFGENSPWYVGTGATALKQKGPSTTEQLLATGRVGFEAAHVVLSGVSLSLGPIRPFMEVQLLDPLSAGVDKALIVTGFSVRTNR